MKKKRTDTGRKHRFFSSCFHLSRISSKPPKPSTPRSLPLLRSFSDGWRGSRGVHFSIFFIIFMIFLLVVFHFNSVKNSRSSLFCLPSCFWIWYGGVVWWNSAFDWIWILVNICDLKYMNQTHACTFFNGIEWKLWE